MSRTKWHNEHSTEETNGNNNNNNNNNNNGNNDNNDNDTNNDERTGGARRGTTNANVRWHASMATVEIIAASNIGLRDKMRKWLLLDNQSTDDIFCEAKYLQNVRKSEDKLYLITNGGTLEVDMKGEFPGYGTVWYSPRCCN